MLLMNGTLGKMPKYHNKSLKKRIPFSQLEVDWFRYMALMLIIANMTAISFSLAYIEEALNHMISMIPMRSGDIPANTVLVF